VNRNTRGTRARLRREHPPLGHPQNVPVLDRYLSVGEMVDEFTPAQYQAGVGLLAVTDRRVLFVPGPTTKIAALSLPLARILVIEWRPSKVLGTVTFCTLGTRNQFDSLLTGVGVLLVRAAQQRIGAVAQHAALVVIQ
jgi:hypothetical protein